MEFSQKSKFLKKNDAWGLLLPEVREKKCQNHHIDIFDFHYVARNIRRWLKIWMACALYPTCLVPMYRRRAWVQRLIFGWGQRLREQIENHGRAYTQVLFLLKAKLGFFHFLAIVTGWLVPSADQKIPVQPG